MEVAQSMSAYDRGETLQAYARKGIPEVWIVDVPDEHTECYSELRDGRYARVRMAQRGESLAPQAFPPRSKQRHSFGQRATMRLLYLRRLARRRR